MTTRETSQLNKQEDIAKGSAVTKIVCVGVTIGSFFFTSLFFCKTMRHWY